MTIERSRSRQLRSARRSTAARAVGVVAAAALTAALTAASPVSACGGTVLTPFCAKTIVLSHGSSELLLSGGGTVDLPTLLYLGISDFPAGAGICPPGPYDVDIDIVSVCDAAGPGTGGVVAAPIGLGFTPFDVPFTLPAGPPRVCTLTGTATVSLLDGMELTTSSDTVLCVADPAPGNPLLPRIDMELLGDPDRVIQQVHPGDQASYTYRVTNNDPVESFTGMLEIELANVSRLPGVSGPMPPGTGVYSVSDPLLGDHFPIAFADELEGSCVPLPLDHLDPLPKTLERLIVLPPGASTEFELLVRPWGLCGTGSCGRAKLVLDGTFSDTSRGVACAGLVTASDAAQDPQYAWPDGGRALLFPPPPAPDLGFLLVDAQPVPGLAALFRVQMQPPLMLVDGMPLTGVLQPTFAPFGEHAARAQIQLLPDVPIPAGAILDVAYPLDLFPDPVAPPVEVEMLSLQLQSVAPTGFEDVFPFALGAIGLREPTTPPGEFDGFVDMMFQMSVVGVDDAGDRRTVSFDVIDLVRRGDGSGLDVRLVGTFGPGAGTVIEAVEVRQDLRGFAFESGPFVFADGFESGDTSLWSVTVP